MKITHGFRAELPNPRVFSVRCFLSTLKCLLFRLYFFCTYLHNCQIAASADYNNLQGLLAADRTNGFLPRKFEKSKWSLFDRGPFVMYGHKRLKQKQPSGGLESGSRTSEAQTRLRMVLAVEQDIVVSIREAACKRSCCGCHRSYLCVAWLALFHSNSSENPHSSENKPISQIPNNSIYDILVRFPQLLLLQL